MELDKESEVTSVAKCVKTADDNSHRVAGNNVMLFTYRRLFWWNKCSLFVLGNKTQQK